MRTRVVRWLIGYCLSMAVVMPFAAFAQINVPSEAREEDDEPNQQDVFESLGAESERSRWFLDGAELVLRPRTYYLHRDYDVANTRAGWALGGGLEFRSGWWQDRVRLAPPYRRLKSSMGHLIRMARSCSSPVQRAFQWSVRPTQRFDWPVITGYGLAANHWTCPTWASMTCG